MASAKWIHGRLPEALIEIINVPEMNLHANWGPFNSVVHIACSGLLRRHGLPRPLWTAEQVRSTLQLWYNGFAFYVIFMVNLLCALCSLQTYIMKKERDFRDFSFQYYLRKLQPCILPNLWGLMAFGDRVKNLPPAWFYGVRAKPFFKKTTFRLWRK